MAGAPIVWGVALWAGAPRTLRGRAPPGAITARARCGGSVGRGPRTWCYVTRLAAGRPHTQPASRPQLAPGPHGGQAQLEGHGAVTENHPGYAQGPTHPGTLSEGVGVFG